MASVTLSLSFLKLLAAPDACEPIAPTSSHQSGPCERPHQAVADAIHSMLSSASPPPKLWPHAFHCLLFLCSVALHSEQAASPFEVEAGKKRPSTPLRPRLPHVRSAISPTSPDCAASGGHTGTLLGFAKAVKSALCCGLEAEATKAAQRTTFDESMSGLVDKPPGARLRPLLWQLQGRHGSGRPSSELGCLSSPLCWHPRRCDEA